MQVKGYLFFLNRETVLRRLTLVVRSASLVTQRNSVRKGYGSLLPCDGRVLLAIDRIVYRRVTVQLLPMLRTHSPLLISGHSRVRFLMAFSHSQLDWWQQDRSFLNDVFIGHEPFVPKYGEKLTTVVFFLEQPIWKLLLCHNELSRFLNDFISQPQLVD